MRIRNNKEFNISINAKHTGTGSAPKRITVPAGATLELSDSEWKENFADNVAVVSSLESGALEITKAVVLSDEEKDLANDEALKNAQALIDAHNAKIAKEVGKAPDATKPVVTTAAKAPTKEAPKA